MMEEETKEMEERLEKVRRKMRDVMQDLSVRVKRVESSQKD